MLQVGNPGRWIVFVGLALAMSWGLRLMAAIAARAGARKLGDARAALGLSREVPARLVARGRGEAAESDPARERGRDEP